MQNPPQHKGSVIMAGDVSLPVPGLIATVGDENKDNSDIVGGSHGTPCNNLASKGNCSKYIYIPADLST
jgi:hypothetical protein